MAEEGHVYADTRFGHLVVGAQAFNLNWCAVSDMSAALDDAEVRGGDRLVSHATGVLARRRRRTVTRKDFPFAISGLYTPAGVRVYGDDRYMQLITNVETIRGNLGIGEDTATTAGTVTATWHRPDGSTKAAAVHVLTPLRVEIHQYVAAGVLSLSLPGGRFV